MKRISTRNRKGVVMLMFGTLLIFVLAPCVGLAVDLGVAYAAKARLQSASDGAVIAATRSLNRGLDAGSRQVAANETAQRFFNANLQAGWLGISNPTATVTFPVAPPKTTVIQVNASIEISTYFLRVLGTDSMTLRTSSGASRRDVNIMVVLDRSGSLESSGSCPALREAAKSFLYTFQEGRDKVGLVTYGTSYNVDQLLSQNFRTGGSGDVINVIDNITCTGWTNSAAALSLAYDQLAAMNEPGVLNAILFFTDGQPNTITMPRLKIAAASTCNSKGNRFGVVTQGGGIFQALAPGPPPITMDSLPISSSAGCAFGMGTDLANVTADVESLTRSSADGNIGDDTGEEGQSADGASSGHGSGPHGSGHRWDNWPGDKDAFGNSLNGYSPVATDGSGRITLDSNNILNAGINALANAGTRIRNESAANGLDVVIHVIGLGNFTGAPALDLLNRVANSPASPVHDPSKPIGLMIYASDAGELEAAFAQVGSEMLRLSM